MKEFLDVVWLPAVDGSPGALGVVACTMPDESWQARCGHTTLADREQALAQLAAHGTPLTEAQARGFFPHFAKRRYHGAPAPERFQLARDLLHKLGEHPLERVLMVVQGPDVESGQYVGSWYAWTVHEEERQNTALGLAVTLGLQETGDAVWEEALRMVAARKV